MNLFIAVMFEKFIEAWSKENCRGVKSNSLIERYWDYLTQILNTTPNLIDSLKFQKKSAFFKFFNKIATHPIFEFIIFTVIVLNLFVMAMSYENSSLYYQNILDHINLAFTCIFIIEAGIKLIGLGIKGYFYFAWNIFDFFVVCSSIVDIIISNVTSSNTTFLKSFQIIRVLRLLRVTRVLRLVKSLKGLAKLLSILRWSMGSLGNVFILMFLILCIFSIMGCFIYESIRYEDYKDYFKKINEFNNFDNFYNSFLLSFRQVTGEDWPTMMIEMATGIMY
jgi:hypothetical protein